MGLIMYIGMIFPYFLLTPVSLSAQRERSGLGSVNPIGFGLVLLESEGGNGFL